MPSTSYKVSRLAGALGAEIKGPRLADLEPADVSSITQLLHEHLVIFFPNQSLGLEEHLALGRHFCDALDGVMEAHPNLANDSSLPPEIFELKATKGGVADEWHTDLTFQKKPAIMSILHMIQTPNMGGDTLWTNLYAAYDRLSAPMQQLCDGLSALHDAQPHNHPDQTAIHPVVRVHPITGKKALYVNEHFTRRIVEMSAPESDALLGYLTAWVGHPQFTVRYRWTPGCIAMWDNRCTQHCVLNDFEGERVIQRVTIVGDQVEATEPPRWQPWINIGRLSATGRHDRQLYKHLMKDKQQAARIKLSR